MNQSEFKNRRAQLMKMMGNNSIAILPSSSEIARNRDVDLPYQQDYEFLYLNGFNEPEAVMVLATGRKHGKYILFSRERKIELESWHGRR